MLSRGKSIFITLSLATVLLVAAGRMLAENQRQADDGKDSLYKYLAVFTEVYSLVNRAYVDKLEDEALMVGAFEGVLDALDPFSLYIPAAEFDNYQKIQKIGMRRSGLQILKERGVAYVATVEADSPAALAGLERGHILSAINGERTRRISLLEIQSMLAGPVGSIIEVERIHQGQKEDIQFELAEYSRPGVTLVAQRGVGVLRLRGFFDSTPADVETSLGALAEGSTVLPELTQRDRLVLDLRGVAGGDEAVAYRVAGLFTAGALGALKDREQDLKTFDSAEPPRWDGQLVVLIDRGTQGPAEVLATILKQSEEATLVGEGSFGHSGRLGWIELSNGDRLQMTQAFFTGPDGEPINHSLQPDLWIRPEAQAEEEAERDEILERGLDVVLDQEEVEERQAA